MHCLLFCFLAGMDLKEWHILLLSAVLYRDNINHRVCLHLSDRWQEKHKAVYITFDLHLHSESYKLYIDMILSHHSPQEIQVFWDCICNVTHSPDRWWSGYRWHSWLCWRWNTERKWSLPTWSRQTAMGLESDKWRRAICVTHHSFWRALLWFMSWCVP